MKFVFLFLGKTKEHFLSDGIKEYADRLQRFVSVEIVHIKEKHSKKAAEKLVRKNDSSLLLLHSRTGSHRVALDPKGKELDSEQLATILSQWENSGIQTVTFFIGGHLGLDEDILKQAHLVLSLSRLTFTHEMARLILLEQLYRACSIKAGHKYHN